MTQKLIATLRSAFVGEGLPGEWGPAIARQESAFDPNVRVLFGPDGARGGAFGLCQMTMLTARGLGFKGDGPGLCDPRTNAKLAARLCAQLVKQFQSKDLRDVAAGYNSGKPYALAPERTRLYYVPQVLRFAETYRLVSK